MAIWKKANQVPTLIIQFYNINCGCADTYYERLFRLHTPERRMILPKQWMADLAHSLCQWGPSLREWAFLNPLISFFNMGQLHNGGFEQKIRSDARGLITAVWPPVSDARGLISALRMVRSVSSVKALQVNQQKRSPWRHQQIMAFKKGEDVPILTVLVSLNQMLLLHGARIQTCAAKSTVSS